MSSSRTFSTPAVPVAPSADNSSMQQVGGQGGSWPGREFMIYDFRSMIVFAALGPLRGNILEWPSH